MSYLNSEPIHPNSTTIIRIIPSIVASWFRWKKIEKSQNNDNMQYDIEKGAKTSVRKQKWEEIFSKIKFNKRKLMQFNFVLVSTYNLILASVLVWRMRSTPNGTTLPISFISIDVRPLVLKEMKWKTKADWENCTRLRTRWSKCKQIGFQSRKRDHRLVNRRAVLCEHLRIDSIVLLLTFCLIYFSFANNSGKQSIQKADNERIFCIDFDIERRFNATKNKTTRA